MYFCLFDISVSLLKPSRMSGDNGKASDENGEKNVILERISSLFGKEISRLFEGKIVSYWFMQP